MTNAPPTKNTTDPNIATQSRMSLKLIETLSDWSGGFAVFFTAVAAFLGIAAWYFSGKVATARQDALERFKEDSKLSIATANRRAEEARLKAAQIESIVEWRTLSEAQVANLQRTLSAKLSSVKLAYVTNDPEALFFAIQLSKCFQNWTISSGSRTYRDTLVFGLTIVGSSEPDVNFVRDTFRANDIPFSTTPMPSVGSMEFFGSGPSAVEIVVGSKPRPTP